jgi:hypothetical protein
MGSQPTAALDPKRCICAYKETLAEVEKAFVTTTSNACHFSGGFLAVFPLIQIRISRKGAIMTRRAVVIFDMWDDRFLTCYNVGAVSEHIGFIWKSYVFKNRWLGSVLRSYAQVDQPNDASSSR